MRKINPCVPWRYGHSLNGRENDFVVGSCCSDPCVGYLCLRMFLPQMRRPPVRNDLGIAANVAYRLAECGDCRVVQRPLMLQGGARKLSISELQRKRCLHGYPSVRVFRQQIQAPLILPNSSSK